MRSKFTTIDNISILTSFSLVKEHKEAKKKALQKEEEASKALAAGGAIWALLKREPIA